jgi:hypothetical protein
MPRRFRQADVDLVLVPEVPQARRRGDIACEDYMGTNGPYLPAHTIRTFPGNAKLKAVASYHIDTEAAERDDADADNDTDLDAMNLDKSNAARLKQLRATDCLFCARR